MGWILKMVRMIGEYEAYVAEFGEIYKDLLIAMIFEFWLYSYIALLISIQVMPAWLNMNCL